MTTIKKVKTKRTIWEQVIKQEEWPPLQQNEDPNDYNFNGKTVLQFLFYLCNKYGKTWSKVYKTKMLGQIDISKETLILKVKNLKRRAALNEKYKTNNWGNEPHFTHPHFVDQILQQINNGSIQRKLQANKLHNCKNVSKN